MGERATTIRLAVPADADSVRKCVAAAYEPYVSRIGTAPAPMLDDYDELIRREVVHVAIELERVVGLIVMWPKEDHFYVDNIAAAPDVQGAGIGSALLARADECARRAGHREIQLYTNVAMGENLEYYRRRGFVETHRSSESGYDRVYFSRVIPPLA